MDDQPAETIQQPQQQPPAPPLPPQGAYQGPYVAPPGYPYYGYPPYQPAPPTNTMAILAIIFAFVFAPLGIVFGLIGKSEIRRTGEGGAGLATAGIWVGAVFCVLTVLWIILWITLFATFIHSLPTILPTPTPGLAWLL
jgi:hypothetical protein